MSLTAQGRALVTGGAGFLGPQLIKRLLRQSWSVLTIDNLSNGSRDHLEPFAADPAFAFAEGDITDGDFLTRTVGQFEPDAVFHLAALHFIPYCIAHPSDTLRVNVLATQLLLDALKSTHVRSFVLASTADVYITSERPHSESDPQGTTNIYGVTKMTAEQLLKLAQMRYPGVRFFTARFSNIFGPGETNPHVLPEIMAGVRRGSVLRLGNLEPRRDYIYVDDVAEALLQMTAYEGVHRIFNVSTHKGSSVTDLVRTVERLIGKELRVEVDPAKVRRVERMSLVLDNSLIRRELNWMPATSLEEGLRSVLAAELGGLKKAASVPPQLAHHAYPRAV
jgi:UDP-glucose 4-epimerase